MRCISVQVLWEVDDIDGLEWTLLDTNTATCEEMVEKQGRKLEIRYERENLRTYL